jgi:hypothetical protein
LLYVVILRAQRILRSERSRGFVLRCHSEPAPMH